MSLPNAPTSISFGGALEASLAANLLGVIGASVLFGVTTIQTYFYFSHYQSDRTPLKILVIILWFVCEVRTMVHSLTPIGRMLDAAHFAVAIHFIYFSMVINFANPAMLAVVPVSALVLIVTTAVTGLIVRGIFTYRIWKLNNHWLLAVIVSALSLTNATSSIYMTGAVAHDLTYTHLRQFTWAMYLNFFAEAGADLFIAFALGVTLAKKRTGIRPTDSVIKSLILYAISTGLVTCVMEFCTIIAFAVSSDTSIYNAIYFSLPKVLLNALLVSLNARERLRRQQNMYSLPLGTLPGAGSTENPTQQARSKLEFVVDTRHPSTMDPEAIPDSSTDVTVTAYSTTSVAHEEMGTALELNVTQSAWQLRTAFRTAIVLNSAKRDAFKAGRGTSVLNVLPSTAGHMLRVIVHQVPERATKKTYQQRKSETADVSASRFPCPSSSSSDVVPKTASWIRMFHDISWPLEGLLAAWTSSTLYGMNVVATVIYVQIAIRRRAKSTFHRILLSIAIVQFVLSTLHVAVCLRSAIDGFFYSPDTIASFQDQGNSMHLTQTLSYLTNSLIADAILVLMIFATAACGYAAAGELVNHHQVELLYANLVKRWAVASWSLSISIQVSATCLIAWRLWSVHRESRALHNDRTIVSIMWIILESGAVLSTATCFLLAFYVHQLTVGGIIVAMIGQLATLVPTSILVRVTMSGRATSESSMSSSSFRPVGASRNRHVTLDFAAKTGESDVTTGNEDNGNHREVRGVDITYIRSLMTEYLERTNELSPVAPSTKHLARHASSCGRVSEPSNDTNVNPKRPQASWMTFVQHTMQKTKSSVTLRHLGAEDRPVPGVATSFVDQLCAPLSTIALYNLR
ncbi:hypothetical protein NM688_g86 [Phlebia brevispora]|uniref:Uncharacterized protein n=1 Tax=Phlebia brevispora TaxID=194682 RepID=A0ACC1TFC2_9APHY|nr:hypothetical protein NM688_g86 [Phlebia brevispora]